MNWLKKLSSKDITLYHASPDNITKLHPYSIMGFKPNRYKGVYFTENFQSLINDWIPYVMSKKSKDQSYKFVYICKISCPKWAFEQAKQQQHQAYINDKNKEEHFGFWGWGIQTFIPEELLKFLTIINCKKYTWENINDIKINQYRHKREINYSDPQMYGFPDTEEGKKQLQEFRKQEKERLKNIQITKKKDNHETIL